MKENASKRKIDGLPIAMAAVLVLNALVYLIQPGGDAVLTVVSDFLPAICAAAAFILLASTLRALTVLDQTKVSWLLLFIGIGLLLLGELLYAVQEVFLGLDMDELFPSIADAAWGLGYLPLLAGLLLLLIGYLKAGFPMGSFAKYLVAGLVILGLGAFLIVTLFSPILADETISGLAGFFYLFYPLADFVLLVPAVVLILVTASLGRGRLARPWLFMAAGFVMLAVADIAYSLLDWQGLYGPGHAIDIAWNAAYCLIGLAGHYQARLVRSL
jgi:hypothetical protein